MYSFNSRVRFSETDTNRKLSITGLMNYLQDCSIFQSEDAGLGFAHVQETGKSWLLSAWNVEVVRRPDVAEEITIATWPYDFKGIYGLRNFVILDKDGNYLVKADSCWFLTDIETGRPVRLTPEETSLYPVVEPRLDMEDLPRKISLPKEMQLAGTVPVMKQHLDTNLHVNNAQYVAIASEVIPKGAEICRIRAEYRKAAVLGDVLSLKVSSDGDTYVVSLCAEDGSVYANVELKVSTH